MYKMPPLNALRAFEAAARHLSLTRAAQELNVSPGAVSHQIRALEALLGIELFERRVRAIALTPAAKMLYPGLQSGFLQIQEAVASLRQVANERVLVVSTPPGLTAKWLAARLYRFASGHPEIEVRISSSLANANFTTDGVDVAVRNLAVRSGDDRALLVERLAELSLMPVCSPRLYEQHGSPRTAKALARLPLIHDNSLRHPSQDADMVRVVQRRRLVFRRYQPRASLQQLRPRARCCVRRRRCAASPRSAGL